MNNDFAVSTQPLITFVSPICMQSRRRLRLTSALFLFHCYSSTPCFQTKRCSARLRRKRLLHWMQAPELTPPSSFCDSADWCRHSSIMRSHIWHQTSAREDDGATFHTPHLRFSRPHPLERGSVRLFVAAFHLRSCLSPRIDGDLRDDSHSNPKREKCQ